MTATVPTTRADRVAAILGDRELDALLVSDLHNVRWLTGFTGSNAAAVVGADGGRRFVTDFRYLTQAAEQLDAAWEREISTNLLEGVARRLPDEGDLRLGFDDEDLSVSDHRKLEGLVRAGIEVVAAGGAIEELRAVKDAGELDRVRAAARLADEALEEVLTRGLVGRTERDVALDLEFTMRRMGAEAASFPPIVAAGAHGALPHAEPREEEIPAGTLCVIDWGAQLDGYASDCTRTFATSCPPRSRRRWPPCARGRPAGRSTRWPGRSSTPRATPSTSATGSGTAWGSTSTRGHGCRSRARTPCAREWWSRSSPASTCPAPSACASRTW
jgi:Xaa-Pro aminopeptidase